jgi:hypothetical protein
MADMIYYSRATQGFLFNPDPVPADTIQVPVELHRKIMDDARNGEVIPREADGTPTAIALLGTVDGMRGVVFGAARVHRAAILDALTGVGFDAMVEGDQVLVQQVHQARLFLRNVLNHPLVLSVTPQQGAEYLRSVILYLYSQYVKTCPETIRNAFREVL